jgi:hypothetical protein
MTTAIKNITLKDFLEEEELSIDNYTEYYNSESYHDAVLCDRCSVFNEETDMYENGSFSASAKGTL